MFANDAAAQVSAADLERLFVEQPELFADYTDVSVETINVTRGTASTIARIEGFVTYAADAPRRAYTATLRKDGEAWRLMRIQFLMESARSSAPALAQHQLKLAVQYRAVWYTARIPRPDALLLGALTRFSPRHLTN